MVKKEILYLFKVVKKTNSTSAFHLFFVDICSV